MTISEIVQDVYFSTGSTSAIYTTTNLFRNINVAYQDVARVIWDSDNTWNFDDSNNTDSPVAYRSLGNLSASYLVPTTALRIEQVEIKDNGGNWTKLRPITIASLTVSPEAYQSSPGLPTEYALIGNEIRLFPPVFSGNCTLASGMAVRLSRAVTPFATSATTSVPGFPTPFHRLLSYAAALDFTQDDKQRAFLIAQKDRLEKGLTYFYAHRGEEFNARIRPHGKRRWQQYL